MSGIWIFPLHRSNPSHYRDMGKRLAERNKFYNAALFNRIVELLDDRDRNGQHDDDLLYGVACDLTSAGVWDHIPPHKLAVALKNANSKTKGSFMDGLPHDLDSHLMNLLNFPDRYYHTI